MIIKALVNVGVKPTSHDKNNNPCATILELRAWCRLISPLHHLGQPIPITTPNGWVKPLWRNCGATFKTEGAALVDMVLGLIESKCVSVERINEHQAPTTKAVKYLIGIDAGAQSRNCGFALCCTTTNRLLHLQSYNAFELVRLLTELPNKGEVGVVLEDPNLQSATFRAVGKMSLAYAASHGQDVGKSMGVAITITQALKSLGIAYTTVNPSRRDNVAGVANLSPLHYLPTKTTSAYFETLTGWGSSSNDHERDAATLIFGRSWSQILSRVGVDDQPQAGRKKAVANKPAANSTSTPKLKLKSTVGKQWLAIHKSQQKK